MEVVLGIDVGTQGTRILGIDPEGRVVASAQESFTGNNADLPKGWFEWTFWQYSDKGQINGINASVDLNVFNGTLEELYKFAGAKIDTEEPQTPKKHTVVAGDSFESIANQYGVDCQPIWCHRARTGQCQSAAFENWCFADGPCCCGNPW